MSTPTPERPARPESINNGIIDRAAAAFAAAPRRPSRHQRPVPGAEGNGSVRNPDLDINIGELRGSTQQSQYEDALREKILRALKESRQSGEKIRLTNVPSEDIVRVHTMLLRKLGGVRGFSESQGEKGTYSIKPVFEIPPMDPDFKDKFDRFGRPLNSQPEDQQDNGNVGADDGRDWGQLGAEHGRRERRRRGGVVRGRIGKGEGRRRFLGGLMGFGAGIVGTAALAEAGLLSGFGIPGGSLSQRITGSGEALQNQQPPEVAQDQPRQEIPRDYPKPANPDNGESSPPLPDPARKPSAPVAEPKPAEAAPPVTKPEATPAPLIVDRKENVEGKLEVPVAAANDALKTLRKILKPKYQANFNPASGISDNENMKILIADSANRKVYGELNTPLGQEQKRNLAEAPQYWFPRLDNLLPEMKSDLGRLAIIVDYPQNDNLTPSRLTMEGVLPLKNLQVASTIGPGNVDGMVVDEVPLEQVANAFGEVVSMDFINPSGFEPKQEGNRWRATGTQKSDGAKVEIVCARDGRFTVRITQPSYKERPGETPQLRVPQIPR